MTGKISQNTSCIGQNSLNQILHGLKTPTKTVPFQIASLTTIDPDSMRAMPSFFTIMTGIKTIYQAGDCLIKGGSTLIRNLTIVP